MNGVKTFVNQKSGIQLLQIMVTKEDIKGWIEAGMDCIADVRGDDGHHFEADVIAESFAGKIMIAQHRMVYATLGSKMGDEIHALALKTWTPDQWLAAHPEAAD